MKVKANSNFKNIRLDCLKVFEPVDQKSCKSLAEYKEKKANAKITAEITAKQFKDLKAGKTADINKSIYEKFSQIFNEVK